MFRKIAQVKSDGDRFVCSNCFEKYMKRIKNSKRLVSYKPLDSWLQNHRNGIYRCPYCGCNIKTN